MENEVSGTYYFPLPHPLRHNHPKSHRSGVRRKCNSEAKLSIGQLVAGEAGAVAAALAGKKKKRRSKEDNEAAGEEERLNRSAHRRRGQKLQEKAEVQRLVGCVQFP